MNITPGDVMQHRDLQAQLQATAYAPPALAQVTAQLRLVQKGIEEETTALEGLRRRTAKEHKEWQDIETRTLARLWVRLKHPVHGRERLTALEEKEEAEYVAARTAELTAAAHLDLLRSQYAALAQNLGGLQGTVAEHERAAEALEGLYRRAFDGPTPAYPEEDRAEGAYRVAEEEYRRAQGASLAEKEALQLLERAEGLLGKAIKTTRGATDFATINAYGGPQNFDILERTELAGAQRDADQAKLLVAQAGQILPGMPGIQAVQLPKGNMVADIFFDTTWSELAFQSRVDAADTELVNAQKSLHAIIAQVQAQSGASSPAAQAALERLGYARQALIDVRRNIMNSL